MRQLRVNLALLAFALAPLVFDICTSLVTGGSLSKALDDRNLWVLPFLISSGVALFVYNWHEAEERQEKDTLRNIQESVPTVNRVMRRLALTAESSTSTQADISDSPSSQFQSEAIGETVEDLLEAIWEQCDEEIKPSAYKAAWKLASLITKSDIREAIGTSELADAQLCEPRLSWLVRPPEDDAVMSDVLDIVNGRIAYLISEGGIEYLPPPPLIVDPCIAIALIVAKEKRGDYHGSCPARPHKADIATIKALHAANPPKNTIESINDGVAEISDRRIQSLTYSELGALIHPEYLHTNKELARRQSELVAHVMRHFLTDRLSAILFDSLSSETQVDLAAALLSASQWMSPKDWKRWIKTGYNFPHMSRLEIASDVFFTIAFGLVAGTIVLAAWEIVSWVSAGWSWYFGSAHLLANWPGWLKLIFAVVLIAIGVALLVRLYILGVIVAGAACIGLVTSLLASPVVRVHVWISSWGTASTIVICSLMCAACLAWLGVFYSDKNYLQNPVTFSPVIRERLSRISQRSRYRPDHEVGHERWCKIGIWNKA
jgi:hypothetical protein